MLRHLRESTFRRFIPIKEHGSDKDPRPTGTKQSGFSTANLGPFRCGTCVWYEDNKACDHPRVESDPELKSRRMKDGRIRVAPNEYCFFHRKRK
jgi:hypothetical protein